MNWIDEYMEFVEETEPPTSYHLWTAISTVVGALGKMAYTRIGHTRIYPCLYIILVGPSGARKSTAMTYGEKMLRLTGVAIAPNSLSGWQAFIRVIKEQAVEDTINGIGDVIHHSLTVFAKELRVFLKADLDMMAALTDLYDTDELWEYYTIKRSYDTLSYASLNFLGATAPDWIRTMIPAEAIGGGFTSRIIFIWEERKGKTNDDPPYDEVREAHLIEGLLRIRAINGEMVLVDKAKKAYGAWYHTQSKAVDDGNPPISSPRFDGYCTRRQIYVRKMMMAHSAGRDNSMMVQLEDFEWSLATLEEAEKNMVNTFAGQGASPLADITYRISREIIRRGSTTSEELMRTFEYDLDAYTLRQVEENLERLGMVKVDRDAHGNRTYHYMAS